MQPSTTELRAPFTDASKRAILYLVYDAHGVVDEYIPHALRSLRPFAEHILVIVNGEVDAEGRARLDAVADDVLVRENVGFDVWGYKEGLAHLGGRVDEFDEVILMNYTFFAPVRPFEPVFAAMDARDDIDFWGITDHASVTPHPYHLRGTMPSHIQSHWIAVRRSVLQDESWRRYWDEMPMIESYGDSITQHESRFTKHFADLGFDYAVSFPHQDYGQAHPVFDNAELLIQQGCPILKRRMFFHDPLYLDKEAVIVRWVVETACAEGFPEDLIWSNVARIAQPRILNTNASMLEVLPEQDVSFDPTIPMRVAATLHVYYDEMIDEMLDRIGHLPVAVDLYVTTTDEQKAERIRAAIALRSSERIARSEVRVLASNRGRDLSGFFVGCRDVLVSGEYDLVVKIHSKKTVQAGYNAGHLFKRQQFENLLSSPGYAANMLALFQQHPTLGVVFPPMIHIGFPTAGRGWFTNYWKTAELMQDLGIEARLDDVSPLAPYGAMWVARPEALLKVTSREWTFDDYQSEAEHKDGSLAHLQERIVAYAAADAGYHTRTIANAEHIAISHTFLEYKLQAMSAYLPGYPYEQVHYLQHMGPGGDGSILGAAKQIVRARHPRVAERLRPAYGVVRDTWRKVRRLPKRGGA